MRYIMILNDDRTWSDLDSCTIKAVPEDASAEEIEDLIEQDYSNYLVTFFTKGDRVMLAKGEEELPLPRL